MTRETDLERQFQEHIARAKEAARLASIAALSRSPSAPSIAPIAPPAPQQRPPPPPRPVVAVMPHSQIPETVRHRIDRFVEFIARSGAAFEDTARERERHNPEFAFLVPGAPFHEYFVWKNSQLPNVTPGLLPHPPPPVGFSAPVPPHVMARPIPRPSMPPPPAVQPAPQPHQDPIFSVSVGTMVNALKAAKMRGLPMYSPLTTEVFTAKSSTPGFSPIEPARLNTRLAEYYRSLSVSP